MGSWYEADCLDKESPELIDEHWVIVALGIVGGWCQSKDATDRPNHSQVEALAAPKCLSPGLEIGDRAAGGEVGHIHTRSRKVVDDRPGQERMAYLLRCCCSWSAAAQ